MRLKVSPCSVPFRYSSSSVSIDVVSQCSVSLVFYLVIRLLIAFMIFAGIFARHKLLSNQLCGTESNAFLYSSQATARLLQSLQLLGHKSFYLLVVGLWYPSSHVCLLVAPQL